jgi:hypothetical protein
MAAAQTFLTGALDYVRSVNPLGTPALPGSGRAKERKVFTDYQPINCFICPSSAGLFGMVFFTDYCNDVI